MASMEKMYADLKLAESMKGCLRKAFEHSLRLLTLQCDDVDEHFDSMRRFIVQRLEEIESRERKLEGRSKEVDSKEESIGKRFKEVESREKRIEEQLRELDCKGKELDSVRETIERCVREIESREKQLGERSKGIDLKEKKFLAIQKSMEGQRKEIELRNKAHAERVKQLELREAQCSGSFVHSKVKVETEEFSGKDDGNESLDASLTFSITMDGRLLQIFLNEHVGDHESMRVEVFRALKMSKNPAKLVLDAVQGFYPPHLKNGDKEYEVSAIRRSCTLVLGQMMRVSRHIEPSVKEAAKRLAVDWKGKLKVEGENSLEVLGFLQLVGAYELLSDFDSGEIFKLFDRVAQHREAPELCLALGFADRVPDFVQVLIKRRQNLAAIRFIHTFDLIGKFPPVPILEDYLNYWKNIADNTCKREKLTRAQVEIGKKCILALRAVMKCVDDHNLQIEHPPKNLETCINLLTEKANSRCVAQSNPKSQQQPHNSEKNSGTPVVSTHKVQQQQQQNGNKRPRAAVSEGTRNDSTDIASKSHLIQSPNWNRGGTFSGEGTPHYVRPIDHYDLAAFSPVDPHRSSYPDRSIPFFVRDAPRERFYYDEPVSYRGPMDTIRDPGYYYDRPPPYGCPRDAPREQPCFCNSPPPFRSTIFP
ncbi:FRIGIDA-like protein [Actinidia chinensis var. chinensis]|uniref:FRIGIDA-like protein n=1 Tax=Actinidia chinensis var. chinensis TaxID=1590841 RepID=A0A2R6QL88_ACTCC|nr:FRIGIDA-like protein [Actinidia chinensis var. chinensis]